MRNSLVDKCKMPASAELEGKAKFLDEILPELNAFLDIGSPLVLRDFLNQIKRRAEISATDDASDSFASGLMDANPGWFRREGDDLVLEDDRPTGTLFLDEFGDLRPDVQTLLLRFLQGGGEGCEIQPVGYRGRIRGLRIRIIAATSDPKISSFYGCNDVIGSWRAQPDENFFRQDLLFRLKVGTIIRQPAVTLENLDAEFEQILNHCGTSELWANTSGKTRALKCLREHLLSIEGTRGKDAVAPAFGHRREIRSLIEKAELWVSSAKKRGIRNNKHTDRVTALVVDQVWRPSMLNLAEPVVDDSRTIRGSDPKASTVAFLKAALKETVLIESGESWDGTVKHLKSIRESKIEKGDVEAAKSFCEALRRAKTEALKGSKNMNDVVRLALPDLVGAGSSAKPNDAFNAAFNARKCLARNKKKAE